MGLSCIGRTEYLEGILDGRSLLPQICLAGKYQITFGKSIKMSNYFWQVNKISHVSGKKKVFIGEQAGLEDRKDKFPVDANLCVALTCIR